MAINVDASQSIDSILQGLKLTARAELVVINKTISPLVRVGSHNEKGWWPLGDIQPNTAEHVDLKGSGNEWFSSAANYQIAKEGTRFQFAACSPMMGSLKIDLGAINQPGNAPARLVWDNMMDRRDRSDKDVANAPYSATARFFLKVGTSVVWVFEVRPA